MNNEKVFITGAGGFVGTNLTQKALDAGHQIVALVNLSEGADQKIKKLLSFDKYNNLSIYVGNICDKGFVQSIFNDHPNIDNVAHLAAKVRVPDAQEELQTHGIDDSPTMIVNRDGTRLLANIANKYAGKKEGGMNFYYVCTSHAYSKHNENGMCNEETPKAPLTFYGQTKVEGEKALENRDNLSTTIVYPPNHFGPYQKKSFFLPKMLAKALEGKDLNLTGNYDQEVELLTVHAHTDLIMKMWDMKQNTGRVQRYCVPGNVRKTLEEAIFDLCDVLDQKAYNNEVRLPQGIKSFRDLIVYDDPKTSFVSRKFFAMDGAKLAQDYNFLPAPETYLSTLQETVNFYIAEHQKDKYYVLDSSQSHDSEFSM